MYLLGKGGGGGGEKCYRSSRFPQVIIFPYLFIYLFIYITSSYVGLQRVIQFEIKFIVP